MIYFVNDVYIWQQIQANFLKSKCVYDWLFMSGIYWIKKWRIHLFLKAHAALNDSVLNNSVIVAEFASENEVKTLLGRQMTGGATPLSWGGSNTPSSGGPRGATPTSFSSKVDTWSTGGGGTGGTWPTTAAANGSSLLGLGALTDDTQQQRATPSSTINSFLPEALLKSEPM